MAMFLMLFFSFNQSSRRNSEILNNRLCFVFLMTIGINDRFPKLWTISPSFSINRKSRMTISTKESLRVISSTSILLGLTTMAFDTVGHD